LIAESIIKLTL